MLVQESAECILARSSVHRLAESRDQELIINLFRLQQRGYWIGTLGFCRLRSNHHHPLALPQSPGLQCDSVCGRMRGDAGIDGNFQAVEATERDGGLEHGDTQ